MEKILERFAGQIKSALGENLKAFVVYGSAATGEIYKHSDYNTLMVMGTVDTNTLKHIAKPINEWVKNGQPIPLIFTRDSMLASVDIFPVEFLDIKENNILLYGKDYFKTMKIDSKNLRLEIERELKSKLIRLRQSFILTGGNTAKIKILLIRSISTFIALLKGVIRLYSKVAPIKKIDIIEAAPKIFKLNKDLFKRILSVKEQKSDFKQNEVESIFNEYMIEIERLSDIIDKKK